MRIFEYKSRTHGYQAYDLDAVVAVRITTATLSVSLGGDLVGTDLPPEKHQEFLDMWRAWKGDMVKPSTIKVKRTERKYRKA